ncbi:YD repeat-containing protein [Nonlabens dokdonensis]|uniref:Uncharacterized protein n=2 Tax=Nonlabens dokdonensis TaxID=328515 RepID=L7WA57_NONDD|nr:hypothetical protein [Nonlabens dokdonensis]AGC75758.1 hypothetical protein DDD_0631 [Nonlabens dokdonensis DSW-6]PZX43442.1 YD repeat-containing protein [Nonlabens dokdonensis]
MKLNVVLIMILAFAKAYTLQSQVFIDKVNAPLNPYGPYWKELAINELQGDVYSMDFKEYPRNGKVPYLESNITLEQAIKDKKDYLLLKNGLVTTQKSAFASSPSFFEYDLNKNIIREENDFWIYTYKYDSRNRVVEKTSNSKQNNTIEKLNYEYANEKGELIVTITYNIQGKITSEKKHFKDGLEVLSIYANDKRVTTYEFDEKGNWIKKKVKSNSMPYELSRSIIYYSDIDAAIKSKQLNWERVYYMEGSQIIFPKARFNNRYASKKIIATRTLDNSGLFYIPQDKNYYYAKDAFKSKEDLGLQGVAPQVTVGSEAILEYHEGSVRAFDKGKLVSKMKLYYVEKSVYITDSLRTTHYITQNVDQSDPKHFYTSVKYTDVQSFYSIENEKKVYKIFSNGEQFDYSKITKWGFTAAGDSVIYVDDEPYLVLKGSASNPLRTFFPAYVYNGEKLYLKDPTKKSANLSNQINTPPTSLGNDEDTSKPSLTTTAISQRASAFLSAFQESNGKIKMKQILADMEKSLIASGISDSARIDAYSILFKELYVVNKPAAFQLTMLMPRSVDVLTFLNMLDKEQRNYVKTTARAKVSSYSGYHSNNKQ